MSYQVTVLITCVLYTFSSKEISFLNVITRVYLMFLVAYLVTSNIPILMDSDTGSEKVSLIWLSEYDGQKTCR